MAYTGSVELISGIVQKNNGTFPLVDASAVRVTDNKRLDVEIEGLENLVAVSTTQPETNTNKLWIVENGGTSTSVPTYTEFQTLSTTVNSKISEPSVEGTYGQVLTTNGNGGRTWTTVQGGGDTTEIDLLKSEIPGTTTTVTFDNNDNPTSIVHSRNGTTARTDVFTGGNDVVTEVRTLSTGKYITITTNLTTMAQTVSEILEVE